MVCATPTSESITLKITPRDIVRGMRFDYNRCPVCHAFRNAFPEAILIGVGPYQIWVDWCDGVGRQVYRLTEEASEWILGYDHGDDVKECELTLFDL